MNEPVTIDYEFKSLIPPLSPDEYKQLEENCKRDGILDSLKVWRGILIDGHNRYQISEDNDLNYRTEEIDFPDREAVIQWIILNQFGRRNITAWQKYDLNKRLEEVEKKKAKERQARKPSGFVKETFPEQKQTRDIMGERIGVSGKQYDKMKTIDNCDDEELKQAVRSGELSINQGYQTIMAERTPSQQSSRQKEAQKVLEAKQRHSDFEEKKSEGVVSIQDARQDKADKKRIAEDLYNDLRSWTNKGYWIGALNNSADFNLLAEIIPDSERPEMRDRVQKMILVLNRLLETLRRS